MLEKQLVRSWVYKFSKYQSLNFFNLEFVKYIFCGKFIKH